MDTSTIINLSRHLLFLRSPFFITTKPKVYNTAIDDDSPVEEFDVIHLSLVIILQTQVVSTCERFGYAVGHDAGFMAAMAPKAFRPNRSDWFI